MGAASRAGFDRGLCLLIALCVGGCADQDGPVESTGNPTASNPTTDPTASNQTNVSSAGEDTGPSDPTEGDPTGGAPSQRVCELYLNCLAVVSPSGLPSAQEGFGPAGTCWQGPVETAEQCVIACQQGLDSYHEIYFDEPACALCQGAADCPADTECTQGECRIVGCGDGMVGAGEVCDGDYCDADCQGPVECSPLTQAGCAGEEVCLISYPYPSCEPSDAGLPKLGQLCDPDGELCAAGSVCIPAGIGGMCPEPGCCSPMCNVQDVNSVCPEGTECIPYGFPAEELSYIGFCI